VAGDGVAVVKMAMLAGLEFDLAVVVWVARFSTRVGHEPQPAGSLRQSHPANPAARECDDYDEHLREDGFRGRHDGNENARS